MRPLFEMQTIQIELTSACVLKCSNCTRFCGVHQVPFFIEEQLFKNAIDSLVEYSTQSHAMVGFMGGEPLLHPQFKEFCAYAASKIDKMKLGLWSTFPDAPKYRNYREVICETFGNVLLNNHTRNDILHAPVLMAAEDCFKKTCPECNGKKMVQVPGVGDSWEFEDCSVCKGKGTVTDDANLFAATERCWIQESWSASVNPKGAWFCEVAGALSDLFDGPERWKVEPGWWKRTTMDFAAQRDWACRKCGAALPIARVRNSQDEHDDVSVSNLERLKAAKSRKVAKGDFVLHEQFQYDQKLIGKTYPVQTYKDHEYRQGIADAYGIYLQLNDRGYLQPFLKGTDWKPRTETLFQIITKKFPAQVDA